MRAKKSLGQNFLINKKKLEKISKALELSGGDLIIEIGPGHGELTDKIMAGNKNCRITAIEKDNNLAKSLKEKYAGNENIEIIEGDALKILAKLIAQLPNYPTIDYKIAGNIPYYITGYLFRIMGDLEKKPSLAVFLIQKEVAERVCAKPPQMNLLAASVGFWSKPKIISYVSRRDFRPIPRVDSAVIKLSIKQLPDNLIAQSLNYCNFIKILFKQPRKTILNNLASKYKNKEEILQKLQKLEINPSLRPQNLAIEQIYQLSTLF